MPLTKLDSNAALIVLTCKRALLVFRPFTPPARSSAALPSSRALFASEVSQSFSSM